MTAERIAEIRKYVLLEVEAPANKHLIGELLDELIVTDRARKDLARAVSAQMRIIGEVAAALKWIKDWFAQLEAGTAEDDPLTHLRRKFHSPVHQRLDAALRKAEGQ